MILKELMEGMTYDLLDAGGNSIQDEALAARLMETPVENITNDSRKVGAGSLFFCISGGNFDGHDFAGKAASQGAAVLLAEHPITLGEDTAKQDNHPVIVRVESTRRAMALVSAAWYGHPSRQLKMIGVTGTKGKTTTTYLVRSILMHAGINTGLIGTIESFYCRKNEAGEMEEIHIPSANTTPESIVLQRLLREMADAGVEAVVMEVSSQALMMDRTAGIQYDIGLFTNISPDHIGPNEHASFEDYLHCKSLLFRQCEVGIMNGDDPHLQAVLEGHTCAVETYGMRPEDDLYAEDLTLIKVPGELGVSFTTKGLTQMRAEVPTPGAFSVYNALAAIAICRHFQVRKEDVADALLHVSVKGRIEMVPVSDKFTLMIDYAHNAVALESLLETLRAYQPNRLVTVFGCGGNRSKLRRYEMGEVSGKLSDLTIITSDNPRFEEPMDIIADIVTGISKTDGRYVQIPDRKEAIAYAISHGEPGDIIVLAGKGHEDYQEIKGKKYPMDERVLIREVLQELNQSGASETASE